MHLPRPADRADVRLLAALLLMLGLWPSQLRAEDAPPAEQVRIVLPYMGGPLAISDDGRWVAAVHGDDLQLIDTKSRRILWQVPTEYRLQRAAFSPDGTWLAATDGQHHIYRFDRRTGAADTLLPNTFGHIAFHPDKPLLLFFGHTNMPEAPLAKQVTHTTPEGVQTYDPAVKHKQHIERLQKQQDARQLRHRARFGRGGILGAYNYKKKQWHCVMLTPIASDGGFRVENEKGLGFRPSASSLQLEGDTLRVFGSGGDLISRVTNAFPADASLNLKTLKGTIDQGKRERGGWPHNDRGENDNYTRPTYLEQIKASYPRTHQRMVDAVHSLAPRPLLQYSFPKDGHFVINPLNEGTVQIGLRVPLLEEEQDEPTGPPKVRYELGLIELTSLGQIKTSTVHQSGFSELAITKNRLALMQGSDLQTNRVRLVDLATKEVLLSRPFHAANQPGVFTDALNLPHACITIHEFRTLDYYDQPDDGEPSWRFTAPEQTRVKAAAMSGDGKRLVLSVDYWHIKEETGYRFATLIMNAQTGDVLQRFETEDGMTLLGARFDEANEHVTFYEGWGEKPQLNTYRIETGERTDSFEFPKTGWWVNLRHIDKPRTFFSGFDASNIPERKRFSLSSRLTSVQRVTAKGEPAWLIVGEQSAHLVAVEDNAHLAGFSLGRVRHMERPWHHARARPIFNGNALLVCNGVEPGFDLIDLRTCKPALHVRLIHQTQGIGTIVYTPDGTWDATKDAEPYLSLYKGKVLLDKNAAEQYRSPEKIAEVIRALAR